MADEQNQTLPRRTSSDDVVRFLEERVRGREFAKIQALNFTTHGFDGTVTAAQGFGLLDPVTKAVTPEGKELVLAAGHLKPQLMLDAILRFEPYEMLLQALFHKDSPSTTNLEWIEKWWSAHGYGNSETNRSEGASTFARFVENTGLGKFVTGRRGHLSRIEWNDGVLEKIRQKTSTKATKSDSVDTDMGLGNSNFPEHLPPNSAQDRRPGTPLSDANSYVGNRLTLNLGGERTAHIILPAKLSAAEKRRLLAIIDLMITAEDERSSEESETTLMLAGDDSI